MVCKDRTMTKWEKGVTNIQKEGISKNLKRRKGKRNIVGRKGAEGQQ